MRRIAPLLVAGALLAPVAAWAGTNATLHISAGQTNGVAGSYDLVNTGAPADGNSGAFSCLAGPTVYRTYYSTATATAGVTITNGTWTATMIGDESNAACNDGYTAAFYKRTGTTDTLICTATSGEFGTANNEITATCTGSATIAAGDRIRVTWSTVQVGTAGTTRTLTLFWGASNPSRIVLPQCVPGITDTCNSTFTESFSEAITAGESQANTWAHAESFTEAISAGDSATGDKAGPAPYILNSYTAIHEAQGGGDTNQWPVAGINETSGANKLLVALVAFKIASGTVPPTDTISGCGLTWSKTASADGGSMGAIRIFTAPIDSNVSNGSVTYTAGYGETALTYYMKVFSVANVDTTALTNTVASVLYAGHNDNELAAYASLTTSSGSMMIMASGADGSGYAAPTYMSGTTGIDSWVASDMEFVSARSTDATGAGTTTIGTTAPTTSFGNWTSAALELKAAGGPQTYTETPSEALSIDTSQSSAATVLNSHSEALTVAESFTSLGVIYQAQTFSEGVTAAESHTSAKTTGATFSEALAAAEALSEIENEITKSFSEALTAGESFSALGVTYKTETASESISAGESHASAATYPHSFTEGITLGDSYSSAATYPHTMGEALDLAVTALDEWIQGGGGPKTYNEAFNEILSMADGATVAATFAQAFTEGISTADQIIYNVLMSHGISESIAPAETLEQAVAYLLAATETINLLDEVTHQAVCVEIMAEAVALDVTAMSTTRTATVFNETITEALNMVCGPQGGGGTLERGGTNE